MVIRIPLNNLGMSAEQMRELVNRMNANDDREWFFESGGYNQAFNFASGLTNYQSQAQNAIVQQSMNDVS